MDLCLVQEIQTEFWKSENKPCLIKAKKTIKHLLENQSSKYLVKRITFVL